MTREEEIEKSLNFNAPSFWSDTAEVMSDRELTASYCGFRKGAQWADLHPKSPWISVKDDLPCNHEELLRNDILTKQVLVVSKDKEDNSIRVCTNYMLKVGIFSQPTNEYRWSGKFYNEVTHWMPLPEPPKE